VSLTASSGTGALNLATIPDLIALDSPFTVDLHNAIHSEKKRAKKKPITNNIFFFKFINYYISNIHYNKTNNIFNTNNIIFNINNNIKLV
jgi:hypothetical protein